MVATFFDGKCRHIFLSSHPSKRKKKKRKRNISYIYIVEKNKRKVKTADRSLDPPPHTSNIDPTEIHSSVCIIVLVYSISIIIIRIDDESEYEAIMGEDERINCIIFVLPRDGLEMIC